MKMLNYKEGLIHAVIKMLDELLQELHVVEEQHTSAIVKESINLLKEAINYKLDSIKNG